MSNTNLPAAVAVIGAGTMGNGIAQVFASCGVTTLLVDVKQEFLDRGIANVHKSLGKFVEKGTLTADAGRRASKGRLTPAPTWACSAGRPLRRGGHREPRREDQGVPGRRRRAAAARDPGQQHVVDLDHRAGCEDQARRTRDRHALHEPGAADEAGRGDPRQRHQRRDGDGPSAGRRRSARSRCSPTTIRASSPTAS
jgi:hypothetical protein